MVLMVFQIKLETYQKVSEHFTEFPNCWYVLKTVFFKSQILLSALSVNIPAFKCMNVKKVDDFFSIACKMKNDKCSVSDKKSHCMTFRKRSPL